VHSSIRLYLPVSPRISQAGNVPFVVESGFGEYSANPRKIALTVTGWLQDATKLEAMSEAAARAGQPHSSGTIAIASDLCEMAEAAAPSLTEHTSPHLSPYLPISPAGRHTLPHGAHISPSLPISPHVSPYLPQAATLSLTEHELASSAPKE